MNVHALLFDVDGTLLDSSPAYLEVMKRACAILGWPSPGADLMQQIMTFRRSPIEVLFGQDGVTEDREQALFKTSRGLWDEVFGALARPFPDVIDTLRVLSDQGYRLGIVTDANHQVAEQVTRQPGCPPMDIVITREESGVRKPSPLPIRMALDGLGLHPEAVLYVGDNPTDVAAGKAAGVGTIGITTGPSKHHHLQAAGADTIVRRFSSLPLVVRHRPPVLQGVVRSGLNQAHAFTSLDWVRNRLGEMLGASPWPGTLNVEISAAAATVVARVRHQPGLLRHIMEPRGDFCRAICHRVELQHPDRPTYRIDALLLWPEVSGYPDQKLELVCPVPLREHWSLMENQPLLVRYQGETNQ